MASTTCLLHCCVLHPVHSYRNKNRVGSIPTSSLSLSHVHVKDDIAGRMSSGCGTELKSVAANWIPQ